MVQTPNKSADQEEKKNSNKGAFKTIRMVAGLIFVSITVYLAFRFFVCDEGSLTCTSLYEWEEILGAIAIVLFTIIGAATLTAVLFKLLRRKKTSGISWSQTDDQ